MQRILEGELPALVTRTMKLTADAASAASEAAQKLRGGGASPAGTGQAPCIPHARRFACPL